MGDDAIEVTDLGSLAIGGVPVDELIGSFTQRLLLVALIVEHPRAVSSDRLVELAWPGEAPNRRRLWDNVHRLRRALEAGRSGLGIVRAGDGYTFDRPLERSSRRFEELVGRAEGLADTSPLEAAGLIDDGLRLWRGPPFDGYDLDRFAPGLTARLDEYRLRAVLTRARASLSIGEPGSVIGQLEELASAHPYDEEAIALLVTALHRTGRRVDALRRLRSFRERLAEHVGLDTGSRLADLEAGLLSSTEPTEPADPGRPAPSGPEPMAELPRWRTSFIGREALTERLRSLLGEKRLVTLVGPGGVGKTRLAVETARRLEPGRGDARFVDLAVTSDPSSVDTVAAAAFGLRDASPRDALIQLLRRNRWFVIFDNCEHVPDAASDLIDDVLDRADTTTVLATSREPLRVDDEQVLRLEPLDIDAGQGGSSAAQLFCARAGLELGQLQPDELGSVEEIVRRLDGLPLALELAAARIGAMRLADLVTDLDHRFDLLTSGQRTAPDRHRTLQAAVDWSYAQLGEDQQAVLIRSSTFVGRFTLDDAAAVCSDSRLTPSRVRGSMVDLVDASLVSHAQGGLPYRLLETLRQYGRNQLDATGDQTTWLRRHAEYFTERAGQLAAVSYGPTERAVIDELLAQSDEYRAAIHTLRAVEDWEHYAELVWCLATAAFHLRGAWPEPVYLVADIAAHPPDPIPPRWPALPSMVAAYLFNRGLFDEAERHASLAIELDPGWFRTWWSGSGSAAYRDADLAIERGEKALSLSDPDVPDELLSSLAHLNIANRIAGDLDRSLEGAHRLVAESQRFQTRRGESVGWLQVARALPSGALGAADTARRAFELGRSTRTRVIEMTGAMDHVRHLLGGDPEAAAEALAEYLRLPVIHSPPGLRILAAAAAYFAVAGDVEFSRRLGNLLGRTNIAYFRTYPAVAALLDEIPVQVDPMTIPPHELETTTVLALERLIGPARGG